MDRKIGLGIAFAVALGIAAPALAQQAIKERLPIRTITARGFNSEGGLAPNVRANAYHEICRLMHNANT